MDDHGDDQDDVLTHTEPVPGPAEVPTVRALCDVCGAPFTDAVAHLQWHLQESAAPTSES